jgi:hypothetical protein
LRFRVGTKQALAEYCKDGHRIKKGETRLKWKVSRRVSPSRAIACSRYRRGVAKRIAAAFCGFFMVDEDNSWGI